MTIKLEPTGRHDACFVPRSSHVTGLLENSFVVPDAALADVPAALRAPADPAPRAVGQGGEQAEPRERS